MACSRSGSINVGDRVRFEHSGHPATGMVIGFRGQEVIVDVDRPDEIKVTVTAPPEQFRRIFEPRRER